jgi:hypothetical protein
MCAVARELMAPSVVFGIAESIILQRILRIGGLKLFLGSLVVTLQSLPTHSGATIQVESSKNFAQLHCQLVHTVVVASLITVVLFAVFAVAVRTSFLSLHVLWILRYFDTLPRASTSNS